MGLLDRFLRRRRSTEVEAPSLPSAQPNPPPVTVSATVGYAPLVKLAGTTTFALDAVQALSRRRRLSERGLLVEQAVLEREPNNPADPHAVAVLVEGERVGYLPSYAAKELLLGPGSAMTAPIQLAYLAEGDKFRAEAWVWLEPTPPRWQYSEQDPPPLTSQEKRTAEHQSRRTMVADALADGGVRAEQFRAGMVNGIHYLELVEPIKELKREHRLQEALELCYAAIQGAEGDRYEGQPPGPWYTEQAAIIHRKLKEPDKEVAVLERWLAFVPEDKRGQTKLGQRLAKLRI